MKENQYIEKKKIDIVVGKTADWKELAKDCVCFANSRGGKIYIGIADKEILPPSIQRIDENLPFKIKKKIAENGGEFIEIEILPSSSTIASTTDGKYYYRNDDTCMPLLPDELSRLFTDKPSFIWETRKTKVHKSQIDFDKFNKFKYDINDSSRVSIYVKQKTDEELLEHYLFKEDEFLTNLGVLFVGKRIDRAKLLYSPTIHFLKFDENGQKVNKIFWENYDLNPKELIEAVWTQIPDWKEGIDVVDGIFRKFVPNYEEEVIRELIANELVHRPYTTRGDVFINLHPSYLEVINPGLFPISVTAANVLHKSVRRNPFLAQVFYDLHLMDKEGSGIDKIYQVLLSNAKQIPIPFQGDDSVCFTINRRISKPEIVSLINKATQEFQLNSKELISLGLIAQKNSISTIDFSKELNLPNTANVVANCLGRLIDLQIVISKGKTKGIEYLINPEFLKRMNFKGKTNLKRIENHRLEELVYQDIKIYQPAPIRDIHIRIGLEISKIKIQKILKSMKDKEILGSYGFLKGTNYFIHQK